MTTSSDSLPTVVSVGDDPATATSGEEVERPWDEDLHRVGRYVLLERLGAGAFGVVRAAYDPELDRKVAIKLISQGHAAGGGSTTTDPEELLAEARMVAKLSHPNVVAVYDVGRLEDAERYVHRRAGAPALEGAYIVMEHLGGPALLDWIGEGASRRPWPEILDVFVAAGRGLADAHAHELVHRDFKPQNLRFDAEGRIRVLDFGLARLARHLARTKTVSGTPLFMAPEQLRGEATDARCDQYAFCVSLWIGLYASWPYTAKAPKDLLLQKLDVPALPTDTTIPAWLGAIVRRGLDPDPAARFADMNELLAALSDDPRERRRQRWLGAGLLLGLAAGGYGLATTLDDSDRCALAEDHFAGIWDEDTRALVRARFDQPELAYAPASLVTVETTLDAYLEQWSQERVEVCEASLRRGEQSIDEASLTIECLDRQLRVLAAVSSSMQRAESATILHAADVLAELGRPSSCRAEAQARLAARAQVGPGAGALELERALIDAETLDRTGEYRQAVEASDAVIAKARETGEIASEARALVVRAHALTGEAVYDEARSAALEAYQRSVEIRDEATTAEALLALHEAYRHQGEYERAVLVAELAAGIVARLGPDIRVDYLFARGLLEMDRKQWEDADRYLGEAHTLALELYGPAHLKVGLIVLSLGIVDSASHRDFDRALERFGQALDIFKANYGELHPRIASCYNNIGGVHFRRGDPERASVEFERSLAVYEAIYGPEHAQTMRALGNLGAAESMLGHYDRAIELTQRTLDIRDQLGNQDTPAYLTTEANLAALLAQVDDIDAALPHIEHIHARRLATLGPDAPDTLVAAGNLMSLGIAMDDENLVERHADALIAGVAAIPEDEPQLPELLTALHALYTHRDDHEQALAVAERARALQASRGQTVHLAAEVARLVRSLSKLERHAQARALADATLATLAEDPGRDRWAEVSLLLGAARVDLALGDEAAARRRYAAVLEIIPAGERGRSDRARALVGLAELEAGAQREQRAREAIELLEGMGYVDELRGEALELLGLRSP